MRAIQLPCVVTLALTMMGWAAEGSAAQEMSGTFSDLAVLLKPQELVLVVGVDGNETIGQVEEVSATSLVVAVRDVQVTSRMRVTTFGERRVFASDDVVAVVRTNDAGDEQEELYRARESWGSWGPLTLEPGERVNVNTGAGWIRGTVAEVSRSSLIVDAGATVQVDDSGQVRTRDAARLTLSPSAVTEIRLDDPLWDGAAWGAATAGAFILLAKFGEARSGVEIEYYRHVTLLVSATLLGLAIDAANAPKTIYRSNAPKPRVTFAPILGSHQRGVLAAVSY